ncbi:FadR family transcriptional regulator [Paenibacillus doosanensis]|uniref:FadR/GntR family transcriptional regulator n=1 Tax=Paenibacillus doosanensis TaxID=1229154 RepID=UPI00217FA08F|nr:FadR/GntR family transcriptional regulator [Paenibacillus doosanensis]MCS7463999.1 FadR family transcriptional regulator [Paenibacillus doosanensis]
MRMLEDKINPIKKTTLSQDIVQKLIELIVNGTIGPGEKLPSEKQLMELFGVGRSSLRESIRALVALELVKVKVPEGTFVSKSFGNFFTKHLELMSKISFDNIVELVEARLKLEVDLAELAALKASDEELRHLDAIIATMKQAKDNEEFLNADLEFHIHIAQMAHNSFMFQVLSILRDITREWIYRVLQSESAREISLAQHERIARAIQRRDPAEAGEKMREHLETVGEILLNISNASAESSNE